MPSPTANRFLLALLTAESKWLRHRTLPAGLSVMALALKPLYGRTVEDAG